MKPQKGAKVTKNKNSAFLKLINMLGKLQSLLPDNAT